MTRIFKFIGIVLTIALFSSNVFAQSPPIVTKRVGDLIWQECEISQAVYEGKSPSSGCVRRWRNSVLSNSSDQRSLGKHDLSTDSIELQIGKDLYKTAPSQVNANYVFTRNGEPIAQLASEFVTFSPNRSLQNIGGQAVWEFAGEPETFAVLVEEKDMRSPSQVQKAFEPYGIRNKLIFVGQKDDRFFVMYDGQKISDEFEEVFIAYCCEPVAYSIQQGNGAYLFQGKRDGKYYLVKISAA
jgi:hypothetical protein